jgi:tungstate transport system ATP-binding protein
LEIPRGGVFAILGPNGAGKSTLLALLHFLTEPESGYIYFQGKRINYPPKLSQVRSLAMVFQRPHMLHGTVRRNVEYGLRLRGERAEERVEEMLARLQLTALADSTARKLSGGEIQRVALARALVIQPKVLFLDEPTSNLDPYNARMIEEIITSAVEEMDITAILVTHNVFQVRRIANRVAMMLAGSIIETGEKDQIFNCPKDERTRRFIEGEMIY